MLRGGDCPDGLLGSWAGVCDGPTSAKGSQGKIKGPGDSSTISQRGEGSTGERPSPPDGVPTHRHGDMGCSRDGAATELGRDWEHRMGKDFWICLNLAWIALLGANLKTGVASRFKEASEE